MNGDSLKLILEQVYSWISNMIQMQRNGNTGFTTNAIFASWMRGFSHSTYVHRHVNYFNNKLTQILEQSFRGFVLSAENERRTLTLMMIKQSTKWRTSNRLICIQNSLIIVFLPIVLELYFNPLHKASNNTLFGLRIGISHSVYIICWLYSWCIFDNKDISIYLVVKPIWFTTN